MLQSLWNSTQGSWVTQVVEVFQESDLPKDSPTFWVTERVEVNGDFPEAPLYTRAAYALYCAVLKHRPTTLATHAFVQVAQKACDYRTARASGGVVDAHEFQLLLWASLVAAMDTIPGQGIVICVTGEIEDHIKLAVDLLSHPKILFVVCRPYCEETRSCPPAAWPASHAMKPEPPQPETPEPFLIYLD